MVKFLNSHYSNNQFSSDLYSSYHLPNLRNRSSNKTHTRRKHNANQNFCRCWWHSLFGKIKWRWRREPPIAVHRLTYNFVCGGQEIKFNQRSFFSQLGALTQLLRELNERSPFRPTEGNTTSERSRLSTFRHGECNHYQFFIGTNFPKSLQHTIVRW